MLLHTLDNEKQVQHVKNCQEEQGEACFKRQKRVKSRSEPVLCEALLSRRSRSVVEVEILCIGKDSFTKAEDEGEEASRESTLVMTSFTTPRAFSILASDACMSKEPGFIADSPIA